MAKSSIRPFYIVPFLVLALVGGLWWFNRQQDVPNASVGPGGKKGGGGRNGRFGPQGPMPVMVMAAKTGDINVFLNGLGAVTPITTVTIHSQISGYLMDVNYTEGQEVKKGDLLALIDPRPYQVALEQAEGNLLQAQSQLTEAKLDLERYKQLSAQDSIASQQVDTQAALVNQDLGLVKVDQAAIDNAKLNLVYCHVTAPADGRVGIRLVDKGNYVTSGDSSGLVVLTQLRPITALFTLPEDNLPDIIKQMKTGNPIRVDAYDRTMTTKLATGALATLDNVVDPTTGTVKLKASFANDDEELFPSQFVNIQMLLTTLHDVLVVPTSAIERGEQGTFVYLVQPDKTVTARPIKLGITEGEKVQVLSGLQAGDQVVVDGADRLKEGSEVEMQTADQADPTAGHAKTGPGGARKKGRKGQKGGGPADTSAPSSGQSPGDDRSKAKDSSGS
jgi:multidrug efflux system membrane fusion protein